MELIQEYILNNLKLNKISKINKKKVKNSFSKSMWNMILVI